MHVLLKLIHLILLKNKTFSSPYWTRAKRVLRKATQASVALLGVDRVLFWGTSKELNTMFYNVRVQHGVRNIMDFFARIPYRNSENYKMPNQAR